MFAPSTMKGISFAVSWKCDLTFCLFKTNFPGRLRPSAEMNRLVPLIHRFATNSNGIKFKKKSSEMLTELIVPGKQERPSRQLTQQARGMPGRKLAETLLPQISASVLTYDSAGTRCLPVL